MKKPNIIYYHSHDTGRYMQPYGYDVPTPAIQRLAEEGVVFRQAFCAAPTCSPSRAALFTGRAPHSSGMLGLAHKGFSLNDYSQTLVSSLNEGGYRTVLCGGQHLVSAPDVATLGYQEILATERIPSAAHASLNAVDWLRKHDFDKPFFLDVGAFETHRYQGIGAVEGAYHPKGPQGDGRYVRPPESIPDTAEVRADWADFREAAKRFDNGLDEIYRELKQREQLDNTIIIVTTDHGPPLPGMKCNLKDSGLQVALIMRGPGGFRGGKVETGLVSQVDILPTLLEMAGLPASESIQGKSLLPLIQEGKPIRDAVFGEINYHGSYNPQRCIRTESHKLILRYEGSDREAVLRNCDASAVKTLFINAGWAAGEPATLEFYNLLLDPQEACNLALHPESIPVIEELGNRLDHWMKQTADPLLLGPIPAPQSCRS